MTSFRDRLEHMMTMRGFKQADLVRKSKLSKAAISSLLSDPSKNLRVRSLLSIAKALGCDPLWLFTGKESGTYITEIDIKKVSVLEIPDIGDNPIASLSSVNSCRHVFCEEDGPLIGLVASDDNLAVSGIKTGDICVISLNENPPQHEDILLVRLCDSQQHRLLKAVDGLSGITLVTDDPRLGAVPIENVSVYGRMIELHRDLKNHVRKYKKYY